MPIVTFMQCSLVLNGGLWYFVLLLSYLIMVFKVKLLGFLGLFQKSDIMFYKINIFMVIQ